MVQILRSLPNGFNAGVRVIEEFEKYRTLLTSEGREELGAAMAAFRRSYGEEWLEEFKAKNPDYSLIVELAANYDFPQAFAELKKYILARIADENGGYLQGRIFQGVAEAFLNGSHDELRILHSFVRAEIDRPRF
jgi:hypothetical protein